MIQEIAPHVFHNEFALPAPKASDQVIAFDGGSTLLTGGGVFPSVEAVRALGVSDEGLIYLFAIDGVCFFLLQEVTDAVRAGLRPAPTAVFRTMEPDYLRLAGATALHLSVWYRANRFCGCCGAPTTRDGKERAMRCTACGALVYPRINPAVLVALRDGDRILVTHYAGRGHSTGYALIAGFTEIGETLEDTVRRETLEEVGLRVKNIRYHASQPWGFAGNLMVGFWADLDGSDRISLDTNELKEAIWLRREEIPENPVLTALTPTMIDLFRQGKDPR